MNIIIRGFQRPLVAELRRSRLIQISGWYALESRRYAEYAHSRLLTMWRVVPFLFATVILTGCIAFPIHMADEEPFRDDELAEIKINQTTRDDMEAYFGPPSGDFLSGRWWVFEKSRRMTEWLVIAGYMYMADAAVFGDERQYALIVEYHENDTVRDIHVVHDEQSCNSEGSICYSDGRLLLDYTTERSIPANVDCCIVYLYTKKPASRKSDVFFQIDGDGPVTEVWSDANYARLDVAAGNHTINVMAYLPDSFFSSKQFDCQPGLSRYFALHHLLDVPPRFESEDAESGREDLMPRKLALAAGVVTFVGHGGTL
jgi:hypothetical protein